MACITFICTVGFKLDLQCTYESNPFIISDEFLGSFCEDHLDRIRLEKVLNCIERLESLAGAGIKDSGKVDQLLWALLYRGK